MKRLIAKRPIQYMGKSYVSGEALPTQDTRMVQAWLEARSAVWSVLSAEDAETIRKAVQSVNQRNELNDQAADVLRDLGVVLEDGDGKFVGAEALREQLCSLVFPQAGQNEAAPEKAAQEEGPAEKKGKRK